MRYKARQSNPMWEGRSDGANESVWSTTTTHTLQWQWPTAMTAHQMRIPKPFLSVLNRIRVVGPPEAIHANAPRPPALRNEDTWPPLPMDPEFQRHLIHLKRWWRSYTKTCGANENRQQRLGHIFSFPDGGHWHGGGGACIRKAWGSGSQRFMHQNEWPQEKFPLVNFIFPHNNILVWGSGSPRQPISQLPRRYSR